MEPKAELTELSSHFKFGQNWRSYSNTVNSERIDSAVLNLKRLIGAETLEGKTFLDIGCGSGVHSLAAAYLGAKRVFSIDIDPESVETTRTMLNKYVPDQNWECEVVSIFSLPQGSENFDYVYSWGVLHHTGNMWGAIEKSLDFVKPGGHLVLALYLKTPFCGFWKFEKRIYRSLPAFLQLPILYVFNFLRLVRVTFGRQNPISYLKNYSKNRGMSFYHDGHDWLGGYPYESVTPEELNGFLKGRRFELVRSFSTQSQIGLFGSGCAEYVYKKL